MDVYDRMRADDMRVSRVGRETEERAALMAAGVPVTPVARYKYNRTLTDGIVLAAGVPLAPREQQSVIYNGMPLHEIAAEFMRLWCNGFPYSTGTALRMALELGFGGMDLKHLLRSEYCMYLGAADFPNILADAVDRIFHATASNMRPTWQQWAAEAEIIRWDDVTSTWLEPIGTLPMVPDGSELKFTNGQGDNGKKYMVFKYGARWGLSQKAISIDDLKALSDPTIRFTQAAYQTEDDVLYKSFLQNPVMDDGVELFHATHRNVLPGGIMTPTDIAAGRDLMAAQVSRTGKPLHLKARHLLVPVAMTDQASTILKATGNDLLSDEDRLDIVVEPRLDADSKTRFYLACDSARHPTAEMAFLKSRRQPRIDTRTDFDTTGIKSKVEHIFGGAVIDWRGLVRIG
jgi:hypothetical protein